MAMTYLSDLINPQVMQDMIDAKISAMLKLTPYARVDETLVGVPGDTVTVPAWGYVGNAVDVAEGDEVELTTMEKSSAQFTVKKAMKAVGLTQEAVNSGYGDPVGQAESQLAKSIAGKVDDDLLMAAYASENVSDGTSAVIKYSSIVDAVTKFEDEEDGVEKVMFIHPKQEATLLKDSDFLSADKFTGGVAVNGAIGKIAGCWVKKSLKVRKVTYEVDDSGSVTIDADNLVTYQALVDPSVVLEVGDKVEELASAYWACPIIKLEADSSETEYTEAELPALTIYLKKDTQLDHDWKPRTQTHEFIVAKYYGVAMTNAAKVVVAHFKA